MNSRRARGLLALTILWLIPGADARAQSPLGPEELARFGGAYRSDCAREASPHILVTADALTFVEGARRAAVGPVENFGSWYGRITPPGYETALVATRADQKFMVFTVCRDSIGLYGTIDGDPEVMQAIPTAARALRYRQCSPAAESGARSDPAAPAPAPGARPDTAAWSGDSAFRKAYLKALGRHAKVEWLARLDGRRGETRRVTVDGRGYILLHCCRPLDCRASNTTLLYSAEGKVVYGKISLEGKSAMIGGPPPAVATALGEFWRTQWVQDR